jgi:serine/threonine-protein kinase ULK2
MGKIIENYELKEQLG